MKPHRRRARRQAAGRVPMAIGVGLAMFATSPTWAQEPGGADPGEGGELADGQGTRFAVELAGGAQALGFKPVPTNLTLSAGAEIGLVRVSFYEIRLGAALGYYHQPRLLDALTLDVPFVQRFTADFGLYGDVEIVVGAEASRLVAPTYRAQQGGTVARSAAPIDVNARIGAGVAVGFDLGRSTGAPVRLFVRYRQLVLAPFMGHNDVPVMGLAALTGGIAVDFGSRAR